MSTEVCCFDGRPFGKLAREFVCVVCARKVCSDHSTDSRTNPFTGECGHACRQCLAETVDGTLEAQVASLYRQLHGLSTALQALTTEVQALRQEVATKPKSPRSRVPKAAVLGEPTVLKAAVSDDPVIPKTAPDDPAVPKAAIPHDPAVLQAAIPNDPAIPKAAVPNDPAIPKAAAKKAARPAPSAKSPAKKTVAAAT